jgi:50S ribosomal protein L16 3-hydroxylase
MSPARFLREHWQKRPLLVRGAFAVPFDPLSADELAALACEDDVESRLVREKGGARPWEVRFGPQDPRALARMPKKGWTLLVQEVNRHVPEAALLLDRFSFLPSVRVDDVMVSFAADGGSVGPHLDSYDVFLVQGRGERRWRYGTRRAKDARFRPGLDLKILERFEPDADHVLEPGDMLYLPPGFAHHGIAVGPCLTYSVGFRAPSAGEMWLDLLQHLAASRPEATRRLLEDPPLRPLENAGEIPPALLARVRAMAGEIFRAPGRGGAPGGLSGEAIDRWFACFATRLAPGRELEVPAHAKGEAGASLVARLAKGGAVLRTEEGKWAFLPSKKNGGFLYVGGAELALTGDAFLLGEHLASARRFDAADLAKRARSKEARALLSRLFSAGALELAPRRRARPSAR